MFIIATAKPTATASSYFMGADAHKLVRHWHDGNCRLANAQIYATREAAEAEFSRCFDSIKRILTVRPMTVREMAYRRLCATHDRYMRLPEWTAAGDRRLNQRRDRIRERVAA